MDEVAPYVEPKQEFPLEYGLETVFEQCSYILEPELLFLFHFRFSPLS